MGLKQNIKHQLPSLKRAQVVTFREPLHYRQRRKNLVGGIGVSDTGRALSVQLDETIGVFGKKRIKSRRWRHSTITGIYADEVALDFRQAQLVQQRRIG